MGVIKIYSKVEAIFWEDTRRWPEDERILLLYYMSTRHRNLIGLFLMPECYALHHLGWKSDRYQKALRGLIQRERVSFDPDVDLILVHNHLKHNPLDNPNKVKGAIEVLKGLPHTHLMILLVELVDKFQKSDISALVDYLTNRINHKTMVAEPLQNGSEISNSNSRSISNSNSIKDDQPDEPAGDPPRSAAAVMTDINMLVDEWNAITSGRLPAVEKISKKRIDMIKALFKKGYSVQQLIKAFQETATSDFLCGANEKNWSCSFDWVMNETNLIKIIEGNYKNKARGNGPGPAAPPVPKLAPDPNCTKCNGEGYVFYNVDGIAEKLQYKCGCWKEVPEWWQLFSKKGEKK